MALNLNYLTDIRGASRMAVDSTVGIVDTVEHMHRTIQRRPAPLGVAKANSIGVTGLA